MIGSPGFTSPEQAAGYEVGPPTDIFSLGAVLAFAATGQGPFGTGTTAALLYRVVHGDPSLDRVPSEVRPLIERCLVKDPGQRPTAADLLAVGALQPTANWLPESIIRAFARDTAPRPAPATSAGTLRSDAAVRSTAALGGLAALGSARRRHTPSRPAPLAELVGDYLFQMFAFTWSANARQAVGANRRTASRRSLVSGTSTPPTSARVPTSTQLAPPFPLGPGTIAHRLPQQAWQHYSAGPGVKHQTPPPADCRWLLIRRAELALYHCHSPRHVPLRWTMEKILGRQGLGRPG